MAQGFWHRSRAYHIDTKNRSEHPPAVLLSPLCMRLWSYGFFCPGTMIDTPQVNKLVLHSPHMCQATMPVEKPHSSMLFVPRPRHIRSCSSRLTVFCH